MDYEEFMESIVADVKAGIEVNVDALSKVKLLYKTGPLNLIYVRIAAYHKTHCNVFAGVYLNQCLTLYVSTKSRTKSQNEHLKINNWVFCVFGRFLRKWSKKILLRVFLKVYFELKFLPTGMYTPRSISV